MDNRVPSTRIALASALALVLGCRAESPPRLATDQAPGSSSPSADSSSLSPSGGPLEKVALATDIPNARMLSEGLLTGGQPSIEQLEAAARDGYHTVVNLRPPGEQNDWDEASKAAALGLRYITIPIAEVGDLTAESAGMLAGIIGDPANKPIMVHCASGNRVGALFALKAFHLDGESAERALAIGREAGLTRLEEAVKELLTAMR